MYFICSISGHCSRGPIEIPLPLPPKEMVSRRRILSRSRDDLNLDATFQHPEDEEDVWYQKDKLYKVSENIVVPSRN